VSVTASPYMVAALFEELAVFSYPHWFVHLLFWDDVNGIHCQAFAFSSGNGHGVHGNMVREHA